MAGSRGGRGQGEEGKGKGERERERTVLKSTGGRGVRGGYSVEVARVGEACFGQGEEEEAAFRQHGCSCREHLAPGSTAERVS